LFSYYVFLLCLSVGRYIMSMCMSKHVIVCPHMNLHFAIIVDLPLMPILQL